MIYTGDHLLLTGTPQTPHEVSVTHMGSVIMNLCGGAEEAEACVLTAVSGARGSSW